MSIYKGSSLIRESGSYAVYYGNTAIKSIYKGSTLIYNFAAYTPGQILFENATPGTYSLKIDSTVTLSVILVGGGGGGAHSDSYGQWSNNQSGGSGGMITGTATINAGTYTIVVGSAGVGKTSSSGDGGATSQGTAGGDSSFNGNIAKGGGGAYTHTGWFDSQGSAGSGGSTTVVTTGLTGSNGSNGSTTSRYGSYGAGGGSAANGQVGYVKITVSSV